MERKSDPVQVEVWGGIYIQRMPDGWTFNVRDKAEAPGEQGGMVLNHSWRAKTFDELVDIIKANCDVG